MIQYHEKYLSWLLRTMLIIHVQARTPVMNAAIKPTANAVKEVAPVEKSPSSKSLAILPNIKGMTIRKENFAALALSIPKSTAVDMVAPERDIPGAIAMAWAIPIFTALG